MRHHTIIFSVLFTDTFLVPNTVPDIYKTFHKYSSFDLAKRSMISVTKCWKIEVSGESENPYR